MKKSNNTICNAREALERIEAEENLNASNTY